MTKTGMAYQARLIVRLALFLCCGSTSVGAQVNSYHYINQQPFDSVGSFQEKIVFQLHFTPQVFTKGDQQVTPYYLDSTAVEKIEYLAGLLKEDQQLVLKALLFDDFYLSDSHHTRGWNPNLTRAKRVLTKMLRAGVDPTRIQFYYPSQLERHEELFSEDVRLELLIYRLPR